MEKTIFSMGTYTNAMRGKAILDRYGFFCSVGRVTDRLKRDGCGYTITLAGDQIQAQNVLQQNGVRVRSVKSADEQLAGGQL